MTNKTNPPDTLVGLLAWATGPDVREASLEQLRAMKAAFDGRPAAIVTDDMVRAAQQAMLCRFVGTETIRLGLEAALGVAHQPVQTAADAMRLLQFARSVLGPDWETGDGENEPFRLWCAEVDALLLGQTVQTAEYDTEDEFRWPNAVTEPPQSAEADERAAWFALVMNAAASLEDAALSLQNDPDAKRLTMGAAAHFRAHGNALWKARAALASKPVQGGERLKKAAQAVLDRWNSPKWEWHKQGPTADLMAELSAALSSAPAQPVREPMSWQPIETAPKVDNALILLLVNGEPTAGSWYVIPFIEYRDEAGHFVDQQDNDEGWCCMVNGPGIEPTHWMPLPAAPGITKE